MEKRKYKIFMFVAIVILIATSLVSCNIFSTEDDVEYVDVDGGVALKSYSGNSTHDTFVVPDEYEGKPVVEIKDFAIAASDNLVYLTIGKNVSKISERAFCGSKNIAEFKLAEGNDYFTVVDGVLFNKDMTEILAYPNAKRTFDESGNELKDEKGKYIYNDSYVIPESVTVIATAAFYECSNLKSVYIGPNVKTIKDHAFLKCTELTTLTLSEGLEVIETDAFSFCDKIKEINLPSTITTIGDYAFFSQASKIERFTTKKSLDQISLGKNWKPTTKGTSSSAVTPEYIG